MAKAEDQNLDQKGAEFESEQLKAVETLYAADSSAVDLAKAEEIGLITGDIRDKIRRDLPSHTLHFRRALAKEGKEGAEIEAYKKAFKSVYGPFLLETGEVNESFLDRLKKVLKFEIADKDLEGRSELISARRRYLNYVKSFEFKRGDLDREERDLKNEKLQVESKVGKLNQKKNDLKANHFYPWEKGAVDEGHARTNLEAAQEVFRDKNVSKSELDKLEAEIQATQAEIEKSAKELEALGMNRNDAERRLTALKEEQQSLVKEKSELNEKVKSKAHEVEDLKSENTDLESKYSRIMEKIPEIESRLKQVEGLSPEKEAQLKRYRMVFGLDGSGHHKKNLFGGESFGRVDKDATTIDILSDFKIEDFSELEGQSKSQVARRFFRFEPGEVYDLKELKKRKNSLSRLVHPDVVAANNPDLEAAANECTKVLNSFYDLLVSSVDNPSVNSSSEGPDFITDLIDKVGGSDVDRRLHEKLQKAKERLDEITQKISKNREAISVFQTELAALQRALYEAQGGAEKAGQNVVKFEKLLESIKGSEEKIEELKSVQSEAEKKYNLSRNERMQLRADMVSAIEVFMDDYIYPLASGGKMTEQGLFVPNETRELCNKLIRVFKRLKEGLKSNEENDIEDSFFDDFFGQLKSVTDKKVGMAEKNDQKVEELEENIVVLKKRKEQIDARMPELSAEKEGLMDEASASNAILEKAFPGVTFEDGVVKVGGFEAHFQHVLKSLDDATKYLDSPDGISSLREKAGSLAEYSRKLEDPVLEDLLDKAGVDTNKGIRAQIAKLKQSISSKNNNRIRDPNGQQLRKEIEIYKDAHKNEGLDDNKAREKVLEGYAQIREGQDDEIAKLQELEESLNDAYTEAQELYAEMKKLASNLDVVNKAGIKLEGVDLPDFLKKFRGINVKSREFQPKQLSDIYALVEKFFGSDTNISNLIGEIKKAKEGILENTNLTDSAAAKKIIGALVAEQFPEMSLGDQQDLVSLILENDIAAIQTEETYEELAKKGSAAIMEFARREGFSEKLIGFQYIDGEKTIKPFKGLETKDFKDWDSIERLFKIGKLNQDNGFIVLSALQNFEGGVKSIQSVKLEKKLKRLIAEGLGVEKRMDEAGISGIVDKAFNEKLSGARYGFEAYSAHYDENSEDWRSNKVKELDLNWKILREELRLEKISKPIFTRRYHELVKEAREHGVLDLVSFADDSINFWDSAFALWAKDKGHDVGQYLKGKAGALGWAGARLGGRATWGLTKLGLGVATQVTLMPLRAVKYPLMIVGKPLISAINLFRREKLSPYSIKQSVKNDVGRMWGYSKGKVVDVAKGAADSVKAVPAEEWGKVGYKTTKYSERTKVDLSMLGEQAKEFKENGEPTGVEIASPYVGLEKFKKEVEQLDKILRGGAEKAA